MDVLIYEAIREMHTKLGWTVVVIFVIQLITLFLVLEMWLDKKPSSNQSQETE